MLLAGCGLAIAVAFAVWPREREPEYQGKKLSDWLMLYSEQFHIDGYDDTPELRQSSNAVRQIGSNAIPYLLKWIEYERPTWRDKLFAAATKVQFFRRRAMVEMLLGQGEYRADLARIGFEILGPEASPVVPKLVTLMNDSTSPFASATRLSRWGAAEEMLCHH